MIKYAQNKKYIERLRDMKKIFNFLTIAAMMLLITVSLPAKANAETLQPTAWSAEINGSTGDWTLKDGDVLDLRGVSSLDAGRKTIKVTGAAKATIIGDTSKTYKNLSIEISGGAAVTINNLNITNDTAVKSPIVAADNNENNKLSILGINNITTSKTGLAGINITSGNTLTIDSGTNSCELNVKGGKYGSGIGGGDNGAGGTITISGNGNVTATGGDYGAGIGGGNNGSGMGVGNNGAGGTITISGKVTAQGGNKGAGIGGGNNGVSGGTITISGKVTATGGDYGAGIGGGKNGAGGTITINGSGNLTATGGDYGAGIGGGDNGADGTLEISDTPSIKAISSVKAIRMTVSNTSLPIISVKLSSTFSSDTTISAIGGNTQNTQTVNLPAYSRYFAMTVGSEGNYTLSTAGGTFITAVTPYKGSFDVTKTTTLQELTLQFGAKVAFDSQGGTTIEDQYVPINESISIKPIDPTKTEYAFGGWYKEAAGVTPWKFRVNTDADKVTANTTLYAKWITPALINGLSFTDPSGVVNNEKTQITLGAPSATGNTFKYIIASDDNPVPMPKVGDDASSWTAVANGDMIAVSDGKHIGVTEVDSSNKVVQFSDAVAVVINAAAASAVNNTVNLSLSSVTSGETVAITAVGDRQGETGTVIGDEKYIPNTWVSTETGKSGNFSLSGGSYTASYLASTAGTYTVTANFKKQTWDGSAWIDSSPLVTDSKTIEVAVKPSAATIVNAIITNEKHIELTMSNPLIGTTGSAIAFTIHGAASNPAVTEVNVLGTTVTLTLSSAILSTDNITMDYTKNGIDNLTNGTDVANFIGLVVTNNVVDAINPIITLTGDASITVANGAAYIEAGATAMDNKDGNITTSIVKTITTSTGTAISVIDTTLAGTYIVHYNVSDAAGNKALEVTRTVVIQPSIPTPPAVTSAPSEANITVTNNVEGTQDLITVTGLNTGDIVKVYNELTAGSLLGINTVAAEQNSVSINIPQLGINAGNVYVSVTSTGKIESLRTQKEYVAEIRNSRLSVSAVAFDKNINNQSNINVNVSFNGNILSSINNGSYTLVSGTDYVVSGNVIIIKKEYLTKQNIGSYVLTFNFSSGNAQSMTITTVDTTASEKLVIDKTNPKDATVGEDYSYIFTSTGGTGTKTYALAAGSLPKDFVLSSNGVLSGVTTSSAISAFTVEVTDSAVPANKDSYSFVLKVLNKISAALKNLTISTGSLNESFSETTNSYTARVGHGVSSIKVTPMVKDDTASVKVNGTLVVSGQESQDISLNVGANKISVVVTATNGTINEYVINVTRAKKSSGGSSSTGGSTSTGGSGSTGNSGSIGGSQGTNTSGSSNGSNTSGNSTTPANPQTNNGASVINNAKEYGVIGETSEGKDIVESIIRDKAIEVIFNYALKESTVTNNNVYVLNSKGNKVEVTVKYDAQNKKLIVTPVKDYTVGEKYTLYIKEIASAEDKKLEQAVKYSFGIETGSQQSKPEKNKSEENSQKPQVSEETVAAKVAEAKLSKKFGTYNEAYAMILSLPEEKQTYYFNQLNEIAKEVYTELNKKILEEIKTFVIDANLKSYEDMLAEINNKVEDPIDKGYFLGELTSWGKQLVYTKDVLEAVDKIIKAYTEKTAEAIYNAEQAVEKIYNVKTREYLREELKKAASKVDNLTIAYFN
jgi:uncharacterized repeat protein (TIGR02543 family)